MLETRLAALNRCLVTRRRPSTMANSTTLSLRAADQVLTSFSMVRESFNAAVAGRQCCCRRRVAGAGGGALNKSARQIELCQPSSNEDTVLWLDKGREHVSRILISSFRRQLGRLAVAILFGRALGSMAPAAEVPQSVSETWADFAQLDRTTPLETEVIREWSQDGIRFQRIRYVVGTFEGHKPRVAAFYAQPESADAKLPAIVQVHGGGQFAQVETVRFWASHGYAAVAVNWGEKPIGEDANAPNTDWDGLAAGFLDPKHHNDVSPGEGTLFDVAHPWNSSWLLYSAAARRALTFLESQPEVDASRMGLTGHSMGGRLTVLTATDPRIKAASPSVGGSGFLYDDIRGVPGSARRMQADLDLYNRTLDCRGYWPLIRCPLLFLGATNDFNSPMEMVIHGFGTLPNDKGALAFAPHMNHRFTTNTYASRVRWFQTHLKGNFAFPKIATSQLLLQTDSRSPRFVVSPDTMVPHKLESVEIYYGFARDPRTRFWRSADVRRDGEQYVANCPVMDLNEPLFAFANLTYETGETIDMPRGYRPTSRLTVTSEYRQAAPHQLQAAGVKPTGERQRLIDDFARGWQDWFLVAADNRHHWNFKTHKVNDPAFFGPRNASLAFEIETTEPGNTLAVVLETDQWRGYTGRKPAEFTVLIPLTNSGRQQIEIPLTDFRTADGQPLDSYDYVTGLVLTPGDKHRPDNIKTPWQGDIPVFRNLRWVGGDFAPRPKPYLGARTSGIDADAAFREQFEREVKTSVVREQQDSSR